MGSIPPYAPPTVGPEGLTVPSYLSILQDNLNAFLNIFGQNQVVDPSSAIYQLLSILSIKMSDVCQALQLCYNQSSPQTAVGAGLDRVVKMNGLARDPYTYSTAPLTLTGTPGTVIIGGFAQDQSGNLWALPSPTDIIGGSITVTATCTTPGNVIAEPGQISIISSPVTGWNTVTNGAASTPGTAVESDSKLRARQAISVALPSLTRLDSTIAAVLAVPNVSRVAPGYPTPGGPGTSIENPTGAVDSPWGNPPHSISMVVDGGTDADVAQAIYGARGIGPFTNGTTSVLVTDPITAYQMTISFFRPTAFPIFVSVVLVGYPNTPNSSVLAAVQGMIVNYLNSLAIGETVSISALIYEAMSLNAVLSSPSFGVQSLNIGSGAISTTISTVTGTDTITVASASGLANGQTIFAAGIPYGTTIVGISGTTVTMSANATAVGSGVEANFVTLGSSDITMPNFYDAAQGLDANVGVSV